MSITQTLGDTLQANATYADRGGLGRISLKVTVGARSDFPFTGYEAALMAGNVILASGNKATPVGGSFTILKEDYWLAPAASPRSSALRSPQLASSAC